MDFSELPIENKAKSIIESFNAVIEYGKDHHLFDKCLDSPNKQKSFDLDIDGDQICLGDISIGCTTEGDSQFESFWIRNPDCLAEALKNFLSVFITDMKILIRMSMYQNGLKQNVMAVLGFLMLKVWLIQLKRLKIILRSIPMLF